jgi:hypothetical protein
MVLLHHRHPRLELLLFTVQTEPLFFCDLTEPLASSDPNA